MRSIGYIGTVLLLSGAVLHFTLPTRNAAGPGSCEMGETPLADLAAVRLYGAERWGQIGLLQEHRAGQPGAADSFAVALGALPLSLWVATVDALGHESCWSDPVQLGGGVGVEPEPSGPAVRWYDVAGRRVYRPSLPGIYFWRDGQRRGRVAHLR